MCFMKAPSISTPQVSAPAPLADPADAPKVETIDFGGSSKSDTETASGIKGEKATCKSSLKINRTKSNAQVGANYAAPTKAKTTK